MVDKMDSAEPENGDLLNFEERLRIRRVQELAEAQVRFKMALDASCEAISKEAAKPADTVQVEETVPDRVVEIRQSIVELHTQTDLGLEEVKELTKPSVDKTHPAETHEDSKPADVTSMEDIRRIAESHFGCPDGEGHDSAS